MKIASLSLLTLALSVVALPSLAGDNANRSATRLTGQAVDQHGEPLVGARIDISTAAPKVGRGIFCPSCYLDCAKWTLSAENGEFELTELSPELKFRLIVTASGYRTTQTDLIDPSAGPVELLLRPFPTDVDSSRLLRGVVRSEVGTAVAGAVVHPWGAKTAARRWWGRVADVDPTVTNVDGEFTIIVPDDMIGIDLEVTAHGYYGAKTELIQPGGDPVAIELAPGATVTGKVAYLGSPVPNMSVAVVQVDRSAGTRVFVAAVGDTTDENGAFEFKYLPPSQEYCIYSVVGEARTTNSKFVLSSKRFEVPASGKTRDLGVLEVDTPISISGRIEHIDGKQLEDGLKLSFGRDPPWDLVAFDVASDGTFKATGLPRETYEIYVADRSLAIAEDRMDYQVLGQTSIGVYADRSIKNLVVWVRDANQEGAQDESNDTEDQSQQISGTVINELGKPVSHASVNARLASGRRIRLSSNGSQPSTETDRDGRFLLSNLPNESITFTVRAPNQDSRIRHYASVTPQLNASDLRVVLDSRLATDIEDLDAPDPRPKAQVLSKLKDSKSQGHDSKPTTSETREPLIATGLVVSSDGSPIEGARVVTEVYTKYPEQITVSERTNAKGEFTIFYPASDNLAEQYRTWVYAEGYGLQSAMMRAAFGDSTRIEGVQFKLPKSETVVFRVRNPDGSSCKDAFVVPAFVGMYRATFQNGKLAFDTSIRMNSPLPSVLVDVIGQKVDETGRAQLRGVARGSFDRIDVTTPSCGLQRFGIQSETDTIQLVEAGEIRGTVHTGSPQLVAGTVVTIESNSHGNTKGVAEVKLDEKAQFHVPAIASGGHLFITMLWDENLSHHPVLESQRLQVIPGGTLELNIATRATVKVNGQVLTADTREPVVGARARLNCLSSPINGVTTETDNDGRFTLRVPPGVALQQVTTMGVDRSLYEKYDYPRLDNVKIPEGVEELDLAPWLFTPRPVVDGRVVDSTGNPLDGVTVVFHYKKLNRIIGRSVTDESGRFSMSIRNWNAIRENPRIAERYRWSILHGDEIVGDRRKLDLQPLTVVNEDPLELQVEDQ